MRASSLFLAKRRQQIAQTLDQEAAHLLKIAPQYNHDARTPLDTEGRYKDFFSQLQNFYNAMKGSPSGLIEFTSSPPIFAYVNYCLGNGRSGKVLGGDSLIIQHKGIPYSSLSSFTAIEKSSMLQKDYFIISHAPPNQIEKILTQLNELYNKLNNINLNNEEKIEIVKEIGWHFSHAMPYIRGSAAIRERLIQTLLNAHGLALPYQLTNQVVGQPVVPFDLVAIFTPSPEQFAQSVTLTNTNGNEYTDPFNKIIEELNKHLSFSTLFSGVVKPLEKAVTDKLLKLLSGDITNINFNEEESEMLKNSKPLLLINMRTKTCYQRNLSNELSASFQRQRCLTNTKLICHMT